jgi:hypothetical protein
MTVAFVLQGGARLWSRVRRGDVFPLRPATALAGLRGRSA